MADSQKQMNVALITLVKGDITEQEVDAIVNAANSGLMGGGGVDGAIHRAGGPDILAECKQLRSTHGQCAPGDAVITGAGNLKAKYVIHAVGPIWRGGSAGEAQTLASAYRRCLELASQHEVQSIAFPSISTGAYGYPVQEAAQVALNTVAQFLESDQSINKVRFVLFDAGTLAAYEQALQQKT